MRGLLLLLELLREFREAFLDGFLLGVLDIHCDGLWLGNVECCELCHDVDAVLGVELSDVNLELFAVEVVVDKSLNDLPACRRRLVDGALLTPSRLLSSHTRVKR